MILRDIRVASSCFTNDKTHSKKFVLGYFFCEPLNHPHENDLIGFYRCDCFN